MRWICVLPHQRLYKCITEYLRKAEASEEHCRWTESAQLDRFHRSNLGKDDPSHILPVSALQQTTAVPQSSSTIHVGSPGHRSVHSGNPNAVADVAVRQGVENSKIPPASNTTDRRRTRARSDYALLYLHPPHVQLMPEIRMLPPPPTRLPWLPPTSEASNRPIDEIRAQTTSSVSNSGLSKFLGYMVHLYILSLT